MFLIPTIPIAQVPDVPIISRLHHYYGTAPEETPALEASSGKEIIDAKRVIDTKDSHAGDKTLLYLGRDEDERWNFFAAGTGDFVYRRDEFTIGAVTVGLDRRVTDHLVLGAAVTYANTSFDLAAGGSVGIDSVLGSIYGMVYDRGLYLDGIFGLGYHRYESERATPSGFARGDTDGRSIHGYVEAGYDWFVGGFAIGPTASLRYTEAETDSFIETHSITPIHVTSGSLDSLQSAVGFRVARPCRVRSIRMTPEVRVQWAHEFLDTRYVLNRAEPFTPLGLPLGRDSLLVDAGTSIQLSRNFSLFLYYRADVGRANYRSHAINGGFQISF